LSLEKRRPDLWYTGEGGLARSQSEWLGQLSGNQVEKTDFSSPGRIQSRAAEDYPVLQRGNRWSGRISRDKHRERPSQEKSIGREHGYTNLKEGEIYIVDLSEGLG